MVIELVKSQDPLRVAYVTPKPGEHYLERPLRSRASIISSVPSAGAAEDKGREKMRARPPGTRGKCEHVYFSRNTTRTDRALEIAV